MDYRLRHLPEAAWRIVRAKAGARLNDGLRRLIELWAQDRIDPLSEADDRSPDPPATHPEWQVRAPLTQDRMHGQEGDALVEALRTAGQTLGRKGGQATAAKSTPEEKTARARHAVAARWRKD